MRNIGLDLGARKINFCEVQDGKVVREGSVSGIEKLEEILGVNAVTARVAFEAGYGAWHVASLLKKWGHEPVMIDTTRSKQMGVGQHKRKNDKLDAKTNAICLERGFIARAHILSEPRQQLRMYLRVRAQLVQTRAKFIAMTRRLLAEEGLSMKRQDAEHFDKALSAVPLTESLRLILHPLREQLRLLTVQIATLDKQIQQLADKESAVERLMTVPGICTLAACAFVSVIDQPERFKHAHQVESYLGLVPSEHSTGGKTRLGGINKAGNSYLRKLLVQSAWVTMRSKQDDPLTAWARSLSERRKKRIAVVAVARRLAGILWAMWKKKTVYDPPSVGRPQIRQSEQLIAAAMNKAKKKRHANLRKWEKLLQQPEAMS
jgi:transposase